MSKKTVRLLFFLISCSISAAEAGFELRTDAIVLKKNKQEAVPEIIANTSGSLFCSFDFSVEKHSFLMQPGIFVKEKKIMPFFRKLRYSLFTDTLFFSLGKDSFTFGEGLTKNYFFVHLPQADGFGKKNEPFVWHGLCEVPLKQFLLTAGCFFDSDSPDLWKPPKWYSLWLKAAYSHPVVAAGIKSDVLFQPELPAAAQKKAYTFTTSLELSLLLPHDIKLYTNAQLPLDILNRRITDWGMLIGFSKTAVFTHVTLSSIAEAAYSHEGFAYACFQSTGITDYLQVSAGIQGLERKNLVGIFQTAFFISDLKLQVSYISKNLLEKKSKPMPAGTVDTSYIGVFSIEVSLNGDL